jgi:hypothetical protein
MYILFELIYKHFYIKISIVELRHFEVIPENYLTVKIYITEKYGHKCVNIF